MSEKKKELYPSPDEMIKKIFDLKIGNENRDKIPTFSKIKIGDRIGKWIEDAAEQCNIEMRTYDSFTKELPWHLSSSTQEQYFIMCFNKLSMTGKEWKFKFKFENFDKLSFTVLPGADNISTIKHLVTIVTISYEYIG